MSDIISRPNLPARAATNPCIRTVGREVKIEGPISSSWASFESKKRIRPSCLNHWQRTASFTVNGVTRVSDVSPPPPAPRSAAKGSSRTGSPKPKRPPVPQIPSSVLKAAVLNLNNSAMPHSPSPMRFSFSSGRADTHSGLDPRCPSTNDAIPMIRTTTLEEHILSVRLPEDFESEMITVSVKKANTLAVVADKWFAETNSHHEWKVKFDENDVNISTVRAKFDSHSCILTIRVNRNRHAHMMKRAETCHC